MARTSIAIRFLTQLWLCLLSFYAGTLFGAHSCLERDPLPSEPSQKKLQSISQDIPIQGSDRADDVLHSKMLKPKKTKRIPDSMRSIGNGFARTSKDEFIKFFDFGIPYDRPKADTSDVLIIYQSDRSLPETHKDEIVWHSDGQIPKLHVEEATANCDQMNVILTKLPDSNPQCVAIMANYQSYHIQRWMRLPETQTRSALNRTLPLRHVSRGDGSNGIKAYKPPRKEDIMASVDMLKVYLNSLERTLDLLKPIAERVARDKTIIVMTCNFGQSELLLNFVCSARARGFDLSNVLVFVTDRETKEIAEAVGLETFFDEKNSESIPTGAARRYGDQRFVSMMFAKVVCVHMVALLGYDILFQDVDIVWYKNPLDYFHNQTSQISNFDVYFQDDGAHSLRYAPFSANSGFYYVRNNDRTRYLFTSLLYSQDIIRRTESHQQALIALLNEHSSLFGLRVKVLNRDDSDFPGGWHYHHSRMSPTVRNLVTGKIKPYIFHMSWTNNKMNKIKFFQQMGDWFVNDSCIAKKTDEVERLLDEGCCLPEALVRCHFKDKPSIVPCKGSPSIDEGKPSWWQ